MSESTKNVLFVILAIIGGFVVLGWIFKIAIQLIGLAILIGIAVIAYMAIQKVVGQGR